MPKKFKKEQTPRIQNQTPAVRDNRGRTKSKRATRPTPKENLRVEVALQEIKRTNSSTKDSHRIEIMRL